VRKGEFPSNVRKSRLLNVVILSLGQLPQFIERSFWEESPEKSIKRPGLTSKNRLKCGAILFPLPILIQLIRPMCLGGTFKAPGDLLPSLRSDHWARTAAAALNTITGMVIQESIALPN
jgi:hypothetical protein